MTTPTASQSTGTMLFQFGVSLLKEFGYWVGAAIFGFVGVLPLLFLFGWWWFWPVETTMAVICWLLAIPPLLLALLFVRAGIRNTIAPRMTIMDNEL